MFGLIGAIIGILLMLFAAFIIFFFPAAGEHQSSGGSDYGMNGIILGIIIGVIGVALLLLP